MQSSEFNEKVVKLCPGTSSSTSTSANLKYVLSDVQGSARILMENNGTSSAILARHDYLPFGEDIAAGVGSRTTGQKYSITDKVRQRFALTERDEASGLDHTWFRKYDSYAGRWTSPDSLKGRISNPKTLNAYSYSENDPINMIDPTGLEGELAEGLNMARSALGSASCRSVFAGTDPLQKLNHMSRIKTIQIAAMYAVIANGKEEYRKFESANTGAVTNLATGGALVINSADSRGWTLLSGPRITINPNGFFMDGRLGDGTSVTSAVSQGFEGMSLAEVRAAVILHELGHALSTIASDGDNPAISQQNSRKIRLFCFLLPKLIGNPNATLQTISTPVSDLGPIGGTGEPNPFYMVGEIHSTFFAGLTLY